ncbi:MAG: hypothetical protein DDT34_00097 [Firmicutes bacterium]|nr:hypothetical protein [Bacillota bacterium]
MLRVHELREKENGNIRNGQRIGFIIIPWAKIVKIGMDIILVDLPDSEMPYIEDDLSSGPKM